MSVHLIEERPGLPEVILEHAGSQLRLSLQGAHVSRYSVDGEELLWLSSSALFRKGAAIRGGIPICWPWFGASPDALAAPQHGFARTSPFRLASQHCDAGQTTVTLSLDEASELAGWQGAAALEVEIRLSDQLWMELRTLNTSGRDLLVGAGLHSYFRVSDAGAIAIPGVTGLDYLDKPDDFARRTQTAALSIDGEIDRVYLEPPASVELVDPGRPGAVRIEAWGHTDLVVWNPGPVVAQSMADFDDEGYRNMVCIEPALALDNRRRLAPGERFAVGQTIRWDAESDPGTGHASA